MCVFVFPSVFIQTDFFLVLYLIKRKGLKKSIHLHVYCFLKSHVFIFFACQVQRIYTILTFHLSFSKYTLAFHIYCKTQNCILFENKKNHLRN